jgi:hypothetical protein
MSRPYYVWKGDEVTVCPNWNTASTYEHHFIFDPNEEEPDDRWGVLGKGRWWPRDVASIPSEFKTKLLILGAFQ